MFLFVLIVKSDIKIFVWFVDGSNDLYLSFGFYLFLIVGTDVLGGPRSFWSQNALSSIAEKLSLQKPSPVGEGGRHVIISSATPEKSIDNIPTKV